MTKSRNRTFSDASIAESCLDTHKKQTTLIKRRPASNYLTQLEVNTILNQVYVSYLTIDTTNILKATEYIYQLINKRKRFTIMEMKTIVVEILSEIIDQSHKFEMNEYTVIYRPILKDIIPSFIDYIYEQNKIQKKKTVLKFWKQ